jgi:hypothetical protein
LSKGSLVNFLSEEDKKKLLTFKPASSLAKYPAAKKPIKQNQPRDSVPAAVEPAKVEASLPVLVVPEMCEFVRDPVYEGSIGRRCVDSSFCPARIFGNLALFQVCPTRLAKLKQASREA